MKIKSFLVLIGLTLMVCVVYLPGLGGPYVLDDEENISLNPWVALTELSSNNVAAALQSNYSGPLGRPIAAISFALNHYFNGGFYPPFAFKVTNLAIHLLNAYLVYLLSLKLLRTPRLAASLDETGLRRVAMFTSALWVLHPIQLTSVLYVVQRMTSLSALFVMLGLILYAQGRQHINEHKKSGWLLIAVGLAGGTLLGAGAKENAVLLPVFAFVLELTFYRRNDLSPSNRKWLWSLYVLTILVPVVLFISYLFVHPDFLFNLYASRPFSLYERLITEARVLWFYLSLLLVPSIQRLGLFHDDIQISTDLVHPLTTLPAIIGIIALLIFALVKFRRYPLTSFAILWYLVGHSLESSIFGLEIAYEHRNYLPSYGVIFAMTYAIVKTLSGVKNAKNNAAITSLLYAIVLVFGFSTWAWANTWKDRYSLAEHQIAAHPDSPRALNFGANAAIQEKNDFIRAIHHTINGIRVAPEEVGFRLDMRLLLAHLESEINSTFGKTHIEMRGKQFRIDALSGTVDAKNIDGRIKLIHGPSSQNIISELLKQKPISVHGVVALDRLTGCVINDNPACQLLRRDAIEWLDNAAQNQKTTPEYHAFIASNAAKLHANSGDIQRALDYITYANRQVPATYYELGIAEYSLRLGRIDAADAILDRIEESQVAVRRNQQAIERLRKMQAEIKGKTR